MQIRLQADAFLLQCRTVVAATERLAVAAFTDPDLPATRRLRTAAGWRVAVEGTTHTRGPIADRYRLVASPRLIAAGSGLLEPLAGDRWLAVGDAAMTFDPLSSHGIATALADGLRSAEVVRDWLAGNRAAPAESAGHLRRRFARYLTLRRAYYADEQRWPDAPFWSRRS